jgi:prolyl-tRNA synthetase
MLPLGLRVQEKIERLLDEEMQSIGELNPIVVKQNIYSSV